MSEQPDTQEGVDVAAATLRSPTPGTSAGADAERLDRARVQASARAKLFRRAAPEQRLGRYVLAEVLGAGGAGKVYAAYDPKLDRRVALKLVGHAGDEHDARLFREARALAKLSHPNIVHVYDVGSEMFEGASMLFIAMELVEGETLRKWMRPRHPTRTIIAMFREIGRGLAAAHDAGLIHRDFKPENVLLGRDGRPRVADFGLVRHHGIEDPLVITQPVIDPNTPARLLTRTGAVMGTPAYMAPEQFESARVDARGDQFSFCIALFEALHGERPFQGATLSQLAAHVTAGTQVRPRQPRKLPGRLRRALERGLAVDPERRFPSMHALLGELDDPTRSRGVIALGLATAVAAPLGFWQLRADACAATDQELAGVWDDDARASLRAAILAADAEFAPRVAETTTAALDAWATTWLASARDACTATRVGGQQSERMMDLRQSCLRQRRNEAASIVKVIREGNARTLARATDMAMGLRSPTVCDRTDALEADVVAPDHEIARDVEQQRAALAEARALDQAGDRELARRTAQGVLEQARALGYRPLVAEAEVALANLALTLGDIDGSEALATAAFQDAIAADHPLMIAFAANHMVQVLANSRRQPDLAEPWLGHAAAATERIHDDGTAKVLLLQREGLLRMRQNRLDEAVDLLRRSCELGDEIYGESYPDTLRCWLNVAVTEDNRGHHEEAQSIAERALVMRREVLGPDHPDLGIFHNALGGIAHSRGDDTASIEHYREAARLFEEGFGPSHPDLAAALFNLGNRLRESGDNANARATYLRALAIFETTLGPKAQLVASASSNIGLTLQNEGRFEEARPYYARAAAIFDEIGGRGIDGAVNAHNNVGNMLLELRRPREAIAEYELARTAAEAQLAPEHPAYAHPLAGLGDAWLALDQPALAAEVLTRAVELRAASHHPETAQARWTLARALWLADRRDDARVHLRVLVDENAAQAERAAQWLAADRMP